MSPPTEDEFLDTLWDHPHDEPTWTVFGDWLEERGEMQKADVVRLNRRLFAKLDVGVAHDLIVRAAGLPEAFVYSLGGPDNLLQHAWLGRHDGACYVLRFSEERVVEVRTRETEAKGRYFNVGYALSIDLDYLGIEGATLGNAIIGRATMNHREGRRWNVAMARWERDAFDHIPDPEDWMPYDEE